MELHVYSYLLEITHCVFQENGILFHVTNSLLTKFVWSRWLDIGLVLFCGLFMDLDSVSIHEHTRELTKYLAILTSPISNNPYSVDAIVED